MRAAARSKSSLTKRIDLQSLTLIDVEKGATLYFYDVDATDMHTFSVDTTGTLGFVTDNGDGTFTYSPNEAFEALAVGETCVVTIEVTATDKHGVSAVNTVTGTNDAGRRGRCGGEWGRSFGRS